MPGKERHPSPWRDELGLARKTRSSPPEGCASPTTPLRSPHSVSERRRLQRDVSRTLLSNFYLSRRQLFSIARRRLRDFGADLTACYVDGRDDISGLVVPDASHIRPFLPVGAISVAFDFPFAMHYGAAWRLVQSGTVLGPIDHALAGLPLEDAAVASRYTVLPESNALISEAVKSAATAGAIRPATPVASTTVRTKNAMIDPP